MLDLAGTHLWPTRTVTCGDAGTVGTNETENPSRAVRGTNDDRQPVAQPAVGRRPSSWRAPEAPAPRLSHAGRAA
jgi:hypothetical protein